MIKKTKLRPFALIAVLALLGCSEPQPQKIAGFAQGTTYHISYWSEQRQDGKAIEADIDRAFAEIDQSLSNYRPDSIIEQFNAAPADKAVEVGAQIVQLTRIADTVRQASQGCYDLTIKPLFDLWGFQKDQLNIPDPATLDNARRDIGMAHLQIVDDSHMLRKRAQTRVDLSSIAQGYSVERISQVLEKHGIHDYLVEIGGELKTNGHRPDGKAWRIAVEKPLPGEQKLHKIINMPLDAPMSVMTSGTYRHYFDHQGQRYSHILDARTGKPVTHDLVATTVILNNPTLADAWSTALLCLGHADGMKLANAEKLRVLFIQQQGEQLVETQSEALLQDTVLRLE